MVCQRLREHHSNNQTVDPFAPPLLGPALSALPRKLLGTADVKVGEQHRPCRCFRAHRRRLISGIKQSRTWRGHLAIYATRMCWDSGCLSCEQIRRPQPRHAIALSGTFGVRRRQPAYHDPDTGYHQGELIGKSVPSGGGRHPTECFVSVLRSPTIATGIYHFRTRTGNLARLGDSHAKCESSADWVVVVELAAVVRRAMFRYRDPRSFRALLVDAGHLDGQLSALAAFCNWKYRSCLSVEPGIRQVVDSGYCEAWDMPLISTGILEGWNS